MKLFLVRIVSVAKLPIVRHTRERQVPEVVGDARGHDGSDQLSEVSPRSFEPVEKVPPQKAR